MIATEPIPVLTQRMQCPDTGKKLRPEEGRLVSEDGRTTYPMVGGVWQLLPASHTGHVLTDYLEHYERDAEEFDYFETVNVAATQHEHDRLHQTILSQFPSNTKTILDVGCGNAWVAHHVTSHLKDVQVCSMDLSTANTRKAKASFDHPNHLVIRADAQRIPFQETTFDVVIASEILEHVEDVPVFLVELFRVIKPGGRIIITTPYNEVIQYSLCIHCNRKTPLHAHLHSVNEDFIHTQVKLSGITGKVLTKPFLNKLLVLLKGHLLLKYLPFRLWLLVDKVVNLALGHQSRLLAVIEKNQA